MAWQTPKTNWGEDPVGPGDLNRVEGNTKYLKEQTDNLVNKTSAKRYHVVEYPSMIADRDCQITHNLLSLNVVIQTFVLVDNLWVASGYAPVGYRVVDPNIIVIRPMDDFTAKVRVVVTKLDW